MTDKTSDLEILLTDLTRRKYENYDIESIQEIIDIQIRNGDDYSASAIGKAFSAELVEFAVQNKIASKPSPKIDSEYKPLKTRDLFDKVLGVGMVGTMFTGISESTKEEARKACQDLQAEVSSGAFINEELSNVMTNYACAKADGVKFPSK